ncbi:MAG: anthranilate phosphoribosyltransferase [Dehalococcoidales bacterium]|nr:anthranilate phosphoribosyltransferase [Dehalococcoidales bacterium]
MIKEAINKLVEGNSLTVEEAAAAMEEIMSGNTTPTQLGAFLTALRIKGETAEEIAGFASVMRAKSTRVFATGPLLDVVGTGGDNAGTFNISTTAAFVAAGAGIKVAKHGNRAASSQCGSADVLEALGVKIDLTAEQVQQCIEQVGIGFMFAQVFHPAMKHAAAPRREIGIRTVFNILGPLTNPAGAQYQVLGVASEALVEKMARVLRGLGCQHAIVVHGADGLDEITTCDRTKLCELKERDIRSYTFTPEDFGFPRATINDLKGGTAMENAVMLRSILSGDAGPRRDIVLLNAAAALLAADRVDSMKKGVALAAETIDSGHALSKMERLIEFSQDFQRVN